MAVWQVSFVHNRNIEILVLACLLWTVYRLGKALYCVFFHPLSSFPGPVLAAVSALPVTIRTFRGCSQEWVAEQHRRYGPVVRIRPNELSFMTETAWVDIYAHKQGHPQMPKILRTKPINGAPSLMSASDIDHARQRKLLSHAFSDQALREHEPILRSHANLLVKQLREESNDKPGGVDMAEWLTYATFDIISDLSLGQSFGNLENKKAHPWVNTFKSGIKQGVLFANARALGIPFFDSTIARWISPVIQRKRHEQFEYARAAVGARMDRKTERTDFITNFIRDNDMGSVSRDEIDSIFTIVTLAGCESPATALSGALWHLLSNPVPYKRLQDELRSLSGEDDLNITKLSQLPYLRAVLDESLRIYPPVPAAMDRVVTKGGRTISGYTVPEGTWVGIPQLATYHSPRHFTEPDRFLPERYLEKRDAAFENDCRSVVQPFSVGPRNCIGQNLAKAEMRLLLAKLVWHFDMELVRGEEDWPRMQKIYGLWEKVPLMVRLRSREL